MGGRCSPPKGPTIGGVIDFLDGVDLPDDNAMGIDGRLYIEDGGLPNFGAHLLKSWKDVGGLKARLYRKASSLTDFSDMIPWFGQSIDAADGEFSLQSPAKFWRARTRLNWNPQRSAECLGHVQRHACRDHACDRWRTASVGHLETPAHAGHATSVGRVQHGGRAGGRRHQPSWARYSVTTICS